MASFFSKFPKLLYKRSIVTDILTRVAVRQNYKDKTELFYTYNLQQGDTPEIVAFKYYGDVEKHWLVLFANELIDPVFDFPLSDSAFNTYLDEKYKGNYLDTSVYNNNTGNYELVSLQVSGSEYASATENPLPFLYKITTTTKVTQLNSASQVDDINYEVGKENITVTYVGRDIVTGLQLGAPTSITVNYVPGQLTPADLFPMTTLNPVPLLSEPIIKSFILDNTEIQYKQVAETVTIYEYEQQLNEKKREIKLIKKEYAAQFEQELKSLLSVRYG
jgi:hypothetical protein